MELLKILGAMMLNITLVCFLLWQSTRFASAGFAMLRSTALDLALPQMPLIAARIHPERGKLKWQQAETSGLILKLKALGFKSSGRYSVPEIPDRQMWTGVHPENGSFAIVFDHPSLTPWFNIVRRDIQGRYYRFSNDPTHDIVIQDNTNITIVDTSLQPDIAYTNLLSLPLKSEPFIVTRRNVSKVITKMHARIMDHAFAGPLPLAVSTEPTNEALADEPATTEQEAQQLASWRKAINDAVIEHLQASEQIKEQEWLQLNDRLCIIHNKMDPEDAINAAVGNSMLHKQVLADNAIVKNANTPIQKFLAIQKLLPTKKRLRLLGTVKKPIYAMIFETPPEQAD